MNLHNTLFVLGFLLSNNHNSAHAYILRTTYDYTNFFDTNSFSFYDGWDVFNKGFVLYSSKDVAVSSGIAKITTDNKVYLGVDNTTKLTATTVGPGNGRKSVRLESTQTFDNGLLIADMEHMPAGGCGTWPAYWLNHDSWGNYSEVDIIEGILPNDQSGVSLWTNTVPVCSVTDMGGTGSTSSTDCRLGSGGCHSMTGGQSFGDPFNNGKGGFYATQIETAGAKVWFFPRGTEPADITGTNPSPDAWSKPIMNFKATNCDMKNAFSKLSIIINTNMCGSWAGGAWQGGTQCAAKTGVPTCEAYVAANPGAFSDAYFLINSIKLFQMTLPSSSSSIISSTTLSSSRTQSSSSSTSKTLVKITSLTTGSTTGSTTMTTTTVSSTTAASTTGSTLIQVAKLQQQLITSSTSTQNSSTSTTTSTSSSSTVAASTLAQNNVVTSSTLTPVAVPDPENNNSNSTIVSPPSTPIDSNPGNSNSNTTSVNPPSTPIDPMLKSSLVMTTNATCGPNTIYTCQGSQWGNCCSQWGWCGSSDAYCGAGCQSQFGSCT